MGRDYLAEMPPKYRDDPSWQLLAEMLRVDRRFRDVYLAEGSGGFSLDISAARLPEAVAALRMLPDDAEPEAIATLLAPLRVSGDHR